MADVAEKKKIEEEPLQIVTDDVDTLKAKGLDDGKKKRDDDEDDGEDSDVAAGDTRLGASDADVALEERRAERRAERKERNAKKHLREAERRELEKETRFLRTRNEKLERDAEITAKRLDALEGTTIDGRISQFKAAISKADRAIAEAVTEGDGDTTIEATKIRDDLRDQLRGLETAKSTATERGTKRGDRAEADPHVVKQVQAWASKNEWFDFDRGDEDSAIAGAIDDTLMREGKLDPSTKAYFDEFDRRIKKRLPHLKKKGANGHDDDADDDDADEEHPERRPSNGNGGPKFRRGGADTPLGKNQVFLSRDRLEALRDAGYEEGSEGWNRMLKRYKEHDRDNGAR